MQSAHQADIEIIERFGGPAKVARMLGYQRSGGTQRVFNWMSRGIPARVKLEHPEMFLSPRPAPHTAGES
ncbi:MAG: hypothetical protein Dbin4_02617 [Alphaproteobacteria bacterium]|nr:hypothetical protein [Alphaproteobacteria bacterium]